MKNTHLFHLMSLFCYLFLCSTTLYFVLFYSVSPLYHVSQRRGSKTFRRRYMLLQFPPKEEGLMNMSLECRYSVTPCGRKFDLSWLINRFQVPSSYVVLQKLLSEEVVRRQKNGKLPVLTQQEFAMLISSIPNCDILDPEELFLGMCHR